MTFAAPAVAGDGALQDMRQAFREVYPAAERGDWQPVAGKEELLRDYVLWPDLRAAWLQARLTTGHETEVRYFLQQYGSLKPARELRYRLTLHLAAAGRSSEYLEMYRHHYQSLGIDRLDCLA
ncbi:MAG: hypothetical protein ACREQ8_14205, partial [Woeseiaceae bacterium]